MRKRLLTLGCTAALTLAYFTAPTALAEENTEASTEAESYITVTDMNGRDVQVPTEIDSVVLTALPLPSIYALTGAPIENLKGVHPGSTSAIENSVMAAMYPELVGIADNFIEGTEINVEELLKLDPDVVIYWAEYENQYEALQSVGIPAVGVKGAEGGDVIATLSSLAGHHGTDVRNNRRYRGSYRVCKYSKTGSGGQTCRCDGRREAEGCFIFTTTARSRSQHAAQTFTAATGSSRLVASMSVQSWIPLQMSIWSRSMSGIRISLS